MSLHGSVGLGLGQTIGGYSENELQALVCRRRHSDHHKRSMVAVGLLAGCHQPSDYHRSRRRFVEPSRSWLRCVALIEELCQFYLFK
jgi:hypothetical protein